MEASSPVGRATPPTDAAPLHPALAPRPRIRVVAGTGAATGFPLNHPYVRTWWTCAIGPTAVADLLRLGQIARRSGTTAAPTGLSRLLAAGLVHRIGSLVVVPDRVPPVEGLYLRRIPLALRARHRTDAGIEALAG